MKDTYIVANWKANKTEEEAKRWFTEFIDNLDSSDLLNRTVIICPSFVLLSCASEILGNSSLGISVGSQDISAFPEGAYTGEVPYLALSKMVDYCIIGHSERRKNFNERDEFLQDKVANAISGSIAPIFCIPQEDAFIPSNVTIVAYEPVEAIGTGNPDTPQNAQKIASVIKKNNPNVAIVLYGGSVNKDNVKSFTQEDNIDGVLVGGASLEVSSFISIIKNA